ncbi:hypothetical protein B9Z39_10370 [Limnohabitans sp. JirII-29]|nr:hypothetical protein B9Z39_10370 [Limnohabitans sp. JirII-29]
MAHMLLKLIVKQPNLLLTHAQNYADLLVEEVQRAVLTWKLRLLLYALSGALLGLGIVSSTASLLLWGALPLLNPQNAWVLVVLPFFLVGLSVCFYLAASRYKVEPLFEDIQEQLKLDMQAICQTSPK